MTDIHTARINFEANTRDFERGFDKVSSRLEGLDQIAGRISNSIASKVGGAIAALAGAAISSSILQTYGEFESAIQDVAIKAGMTAKEMEDLQKFALKMGADTVFSATEAAKAMGNLTAAGLSTKDAMEALPAVLNAAAASGESLEQTSSFLTTAMNQFGLSASDMPAIADALTQAGLASSASFSEIGAALSNVGGVASMFGMDIRETAAALGVFHDQGIKGAEAGTQLKSMLTAMSSAEGEKALKRIGVSISYTAKDIEALAKQMGTPLPGTWVEGAKLSAGQLLNLEVKIESTRKKIQSLEKQAASGKDVDATLAKARQELANLESQFNSGGSAIRRFIVDTKALKDKGIPQIGQLKPITAVVKDISKALAGMSEIDRARAVKEIAGSYGQLGLQALLAAGGLDKMTEEMLKQENTALIAQKQMGTLKNLLGSLGGSLEALSITVGGPVIEKAIKPLINGLINVINILTGLASGEISLDRVFQGIKRSLVKGWKTLKDSLTPGRYMGRDSTWKYGLHGLFEVDFDELRDKASAAIKRVREVIKNFIYRIRDMIVGFFNKGGSSGSGGAGGLSTVGLGVAGSGILSTVAGQIVGELGSEEVWYKTLFSKIRSFIVGIVSKLNRVLNDLILSLTSGSFQVDLSGYAGVLAGGLEGVYKKTIAIIRNLLMRIQVKVNSLLDRTLGLLNVGEFYKDLSNKFSKELTKELDLKTTLLKIGYIIQNLLARFNRRMVLFATHDLPKALESLFKGISNFFTRTLPRVMSRLSSLVEGFLQGGTNPFRRTSGILEWLIPTIEQITLFVSRSVSAIKEGLLKSFYRIEGTVQSLFLRLAKALRDIADSAETSPIFRIYLTGIASALESLAKINVEDILTMFAAVKAFVAFKTTIRLTLVTYLIGKFHDIIQAIKSGDTVGVIREVVMALGLLALLNLDKVRMYQTYINNFIQTVLRFAQSAMHSAIGSIRMISNSFAQLTRTDIGTLEKLGNATASFARGIGGLAATMVGGILIAKAIEHFGLAIDALTKGDWNKVIENVVPAILALVGAFAAFKFGDFLTKGRAIKPPLIPKDVQKELTTDLPEFGRRFTASADQLAKLNPKQAQARVAQILEAVEGTNKKLSKVNVSNYLRRESFTILKDAAEELRALEPTLRGVPKVDKFQRFRDAMHEIADLGKENLTTSGLFKAEDINARLAEVKKVANQMGEDFKEISKNMPDDKARNRLLGSVNAAILEVNKIPKLTASSTQADIDAVTNQINGLNSIVGNIGANQADFSQIPTSVDYGALLGRLKQVGDFDFTSFNRMTVDDKQAELKKLQDYAVYMGDLGPTIATLPDGGQTGKFKQAFADFSAAAAEITKVDASQLDLAGINKLNGSVRIMVDAANQMGGMTDAIGKLPSADMTSNMKRVIDEIGQMADPSTLRGASAEDRAKYLNDLRNLSLEAQNALVEAGKIPDVPIEKVNRFGQVLGSLGSIFQESRNWLGASIMGIGGGLFINGLIQSVQLINEQKPINEAFLQSLGGLATAAAGFAVTNPQMIKDIGGALYGMFNNLSGLAKFAVSATSIVGIVLLFIEAIRSGVLQKSIDEAASVLRRIFEGPGQTETTGAVINQILGPEDKMDEAVKKRMSGVQESINLAFGRMNVGGAGKEGPFTNLVNQLHVAMAAGVTGFNTEEFSKKFSDSIKAIPSGLTQQQAADWLIKQLNLTNLPDMSEGVKKVLMPRISEALTNAFGSAGPAINKKVNDLINNALSGATEQEKSAFLTALTLDFTGLTNAATKGEDALIKFIQDKMKEALGKVGTDKGFVKTQAEAAAVKFGEIFAGITPDMEGAIATSGLTDLMRGAFSNALSAPSVGTLTEDQKTKLQGVLSRFEAAFNEEVKKAGGLENVDFQALIFALQDQFASEFEDFGFTENQKIAVVDNFRRAIAQLVLGAQDQTSGNLPTGTTSSATLVGGLISNFIEGLKNAPKPEVKVPINTSPDIIPTEDAEKIAEAKRKALEPVNREFAKTANDPVRLSSKLFVKPEFATTTDYSAATWMQNSNVTIDPDAAKNATESFNAVVKLEGEIKKLSPASQDFVNKMAAIKDNINVAKDAIVLLGTTLTTSFGAGSAIMMGIEGFKWTFEHIYNFITTNYPNLFGPEGTLVTLFAGLFGEDGILTTLVNSVFGQAGVFVGGIDIVKSKLGELETRAVAMAAAIGNAFSPITKMMLLPFADGIIRIGKLLQEAGKTDSTGMLSGLSTLGAVLVQSAEGIKSMDRGGLGKANTPYLVGAGAQPELVVPNSNASFIPNFDRYMQGAGAPIAQGKSRDKSAAPVTINITAEQDIEKTLQQVELAMKRRNREFNIRPN